MGGERMKLDSQIRKGSVTNLAKEQENNRVNFRNQISTNCNMGKM